MQDLRYLILISATGSFKWALVFVGKIQRLDLKDDPSQGGARRSDESATESTGGHRLVSA
ncbi:hypothetical protein [Aquipseudomonas ullengensis]|uniref:Uncharacterized protein n=1 Tax=Aquipseudomonas ullengensis TaxID=2759166 RepID=A0A7W4LJ01_9GAMM|nr:hypothetical protein [Pseudomonas ullengensis]MBB2493976.1 hypothetical protein [Pseudomonas ullengensis]